MSDDPLDNLSVEEYDSYFRKECKMKMKCLKDNPTCLECVNSKCDTLKAEVERLSGKTGFCAQCEAYAKERDSLILTLAKERDGFGKRETELIKELDNAKEKIRTNRDALLRQLDDSDDKIKVLTVNSDALKAELEDKKGFMGRGYYMGMEETYSKRIEELMKDCDRWRGIAEKMRETIRWAAQTVHQAYHGKDTFMECPKNTCDAAKQGLALYDEAVKS